MADPEDVRIGRLLHAVRRRSGLRQADVAAVAGVPRGDVLAIEAGEVGRVRYERVRRVFEAAGGRARLATWWHGAAADRLLDERHAALVERAVSVMQARGWRTEIEVSFSEFGERGSIDILGGRPELSAVAVCEVKSELGSLEETNRTLDAKVRLAPAIVRERLGWRPHVVGRILIVPDGSTARRVIAHHQHTMASAYPARGRDVRGWLRSPAAPMSGIWFLSEVGDRDLIAR